MVTTMYNNNNYLRALKGYSINCALVSKVIQSPTLYLSDFVDKRGSKVKKTSKEDLRKFYAMSDESDKGTYMLELCTYHKFIILFLFVFL